MSTQFKMIYSFAILMFLIEFCFCENSTNLYRIDPDQSRTFKELISARGFTLLSYPVVTDDGYILTLHRVVPNNFSSQIDYSLSRKPVIVQHGLRGSANNFFINSPFLKSEDNPDGCGDNFGFCLLFTGRYDVWLPNSRGNGYSDGHVRLTTADKEYWRFTFDQMALYDTPAVIERVQRETGHHKVGFIGYSQGASILFGLLSLRPEYARMIEPAIAWAPPLFIGQMSSPIKYLVPLTKLLQKLGGKFIISHEIINKVSQMVCQPPLAHLCGLFMSAHVNTTRVPVYFNYLPSAISNWDLVHFAQLVKSGKFVRYDYGNATLNERVYGRSTAPEFPLENIPENYPIVIIRSNSDHYVAKSDAELLIQTLRTNKLKVHDYLIPDKEEWGHFDYVVGKGAGKLFFDKTIKFLDQFSNN